jgi:hypothetical protein
VASQGGLGPWRRDMWCIPEVDGTYVARMEDVLDLYAETPDPKRPVVCFDESPADRRGAPADPGHAGPARALRLPGNVSETQPAPKPNGCSPHSALASNSFAPIQTPPKSHNLCAELLDVLQVRGGREPGGGLEG